MGPPIGKKGEKMGNYLLISDAAKEVKVESHVLRYWEEELHLPIKRNELGHRYYTEEDVERFKQIKSMKERGLQLKAIKMILKDGKLDVLSMDEAGTEDGKEGAGRTNRMETPMENMIPEEASLDSETTQGMAKRDNMSGENIPKGRATQPDMPQSDMLQSGMPQTGMPQTDISQPSISQSGMPRTGMSQSGMSQTCMPQTGMPQPGMSQIDMSQSGMSRTNMSQSGMPRTGMSRTGMSQSGMPRTGTSQSGMPRTGMPQSGMPRTGMSQSRMSETARRAAERISPSSGDMAIDIIAQRDKEQVAWKRSISQESKEEKSRRLQWLLQQLIRQTLQENNGALCREIRESVVKELDYQFRMQEEREEARDRMLAQRDEEHFKKMDELLRQKSRLRRRKEEKEQEKKESGRKKQEKKSDEIGQEEGSQEENKDGQAVATEKKKRRFF